MRVFIVSGIYHSIALLPHFLKYYSGLGIKEYLFHHNTELIPSADVEECIRNAGIEAQCWHWQGVYNYRLQHEWRLKMHREYVADADWVVIADLDEFIEFAPTVPEAINYCEQEGYNWIVGEFVDRISESGELMDIDPNTDIFKQFPRETEISRVILHAPYKRTVAVKGAHFPLHNCYEYDSTIQIGLEQGRVRQRPQIAKVHHFKWSKGVVDVLKQRSIIYQRLSLCNPIDYEEPFRQCERFLKFYADKKRLPVLDEDLARFQTD